MRVLYVAIHPNALSESYIRSEVEWMQSRGVDVCMLGQTPHHVAYENTVPPDLVQVGGTLGEALARFRPDIVQMHWLFVARSYFEELKAVEVPVTVRGHSFDFSPKTVADTVAMQSVRKVWLFPPFAAEAAEVGAGKAEPLSACYEPRCFRPAPSPRGGRYVFHSTAGVPAKGIDEYLAIARMLPEVSFKLAMTRALAPFDGYPEMVMRQAPRNVEVLLNVPRERMEPLMQDAAVYWKGFGPKHRFGMPVSIAEAMGCGVFVLAPDVPAAKSYVGDAGLCYANVAEAAQTIVEVLGEPDEAYQARRRLILDRAKLFTTDHVLPAIIETWRGILSGR